MIKQSISFQKACLVALRQPKLLKCESAGLTHRMPKSCVWSVFRELSPSTSGCSEGMPFETDWCAWGGEGWWGAGFDAGLVTVNAKFSRFLSLLILLKTRFTSSVREPLPWAHYVHTCLSWNWVWISLCTWSNCDNMLIFSTSSCKLGFHPQRSTPSILKASVPFYPSIFIKLENALTSQGAGDHAVGLVLKYLYSTTVLNSCL